MRRPRQSLFVGWTHFWIQLTKVLKNPIFRVLTVVGNAALLFCAAALYFAESGANPGIASFSDAIWWAFVTMTTVGYGDVVPVTGFGRLIAVALMLSGGVLFLSFVALLSSAFTELEFLELKKEMGELKEVLAELQRSLAQRDRSGP